MSITSIFQPAPRNQSYWHSTAKAAVIDSLRRAEAFDDKARRDIWQALHAFLDGEHRSELETRLKALYPNTASDLNRGEHGHRYFPLIQMMAQRLSVVMAHTAPETWLERNGERLPEDDPQVQQMRRDWETCEIDVTLATAELWSTTMGQCLLQPCFRKGVMRWDLHAPYEIWIDQDPEDPSRLEGARHISVILPQPADSSDVHTDTLYYTWRRESVRDEQGREVGARWFSFLHDGSGNLHVNPLFSDPDGINGYGLHPFVVWRTERPPAGSFWVPPRKGWYHAQLASDVKLVDLDLHLRTQIHAQPVATGGEFKTIALGPDKLIHSPDNDFQLEYVSQKPNLNLLIDGFDFDLRISAVAEGLPADVFSQASTSRTLSAKQLESAALRHRRQRTIPWHKRALQRTWQVHRAVGNYWADQGADRIRYDDDLTLGIQFAPLPEVFDRFQDTQASMLEIQNGISTASDVLMRRLGITRQEADRMVERNRAELDALTPPEDPAV
jgi:hypothetical protein